MEYIYGALLLHKLEQPVTEESLKKVISATGVEIDEAKVKTLITSLKDVDIDKELESASITTAAIPAQEGEKQGEDKAKEEKKEEKKEEAAEGLGSLFG